MDTWNALRLQVEWGADEALLPQPQRRDRQPAAPPADAPAEAAPASADYAAWCEALARSDGAGLAQTATRLVLPSGPPTATLLVLSGCPGAEEDRSGEAFCGPDGVFARRMLASAGLPPDQLCLAYLVPWRPPGARPPTGAELALCRQFLLQLLRLGPPRLLLALGTLPARTLIGAAARRGRWSELPLEGSNFMLPVLPTLGSAVLRADPAQKPLAWADLRLLRRRMDDITRS